MTKDDIIQRMQEAGLKAPARGDFIFIHWDQIALLLAHELEACAQVCESRATPGTGSVNILYGAADAIRARGNKHD